jgi:hypothetical protein
MQCRPKTTQVKTIRYSINQFLQGYPSSIMINHLQILIEVISLPFLIHLEGQTRKTQCINGLVPITLTLLV